MPNAWVGRSAVTLSLNSKVHDEQDPWNFDSMLPPVSADASYMRRSFVIWVMLCCLLLCVLS